MIKTLKASKPPEVSDEHTENNPEVLSQLAQRYGASSKLGFHDVYSVDDAEMLAFIPRPAYALIVIVPEEAYYAARAEEVASMPVYDGSGPDEPVFWFKQTIGNTCGTMALLHGLCNSGAKQYLQPDSLFGNLLEKAIPLKPEPRAQLLYDSAELEEAHSVVAQTGQTAAPPAEEENKLHFICFAKATDGHLWELNGDMKGPVDRGALSESEDALSEKALDLGIRTFLNKAKSSGIGNIRFSIVAMAPSLD